MNASTLTSCTMAILVAAVPAFAERSRSHGSGRSHGSSGHSGSTSHGVRSGGQSQSSHGARQHPAARIRNHRGESGHSSREGHGRHSGVSVLLGVGDRGHGGYGGYGYGYGYPTYRSYGHHDDGGALRILARPNAARVIVDGYYAGIADDFDGVLQRLNVAPGRHEILLELEGYQTARFEVYTPQGHTIKLRHRMVPGAMGAAGGAPYPGADRGHADRGHGDQGHDDGADDDGDWDASEPLDDARRPADARSGGDAGSLAIEVSPPDASVYVDGRLVGRAGELSNLRLTAGPHTVEVVRPGYRPESRRIELRPGEVTRLRLDLAR